MSKSFKPLSLEILNVGKLIKKSKKHFCWKFELDGSLLSLDLYSSRISGKRSIILEGNKVIETKASGIGAKYEVPIPKHKIIIYEITNAHFELQVDYKTFSSTLNTLKTNFSVPVKLSLQNKPIKNTHWQKDNFGFPKIDQALIKKPQKTPLNPQSKTIKNNEPLSISKAPSTQKKTQITSLNIFDLPKLSPQDFLSDILSEPLSSSRNPFKDPESPISSHNLQKPKNLTNLIPLLNLNNLHISLNDNPDTQKNLKNPTFPNHSSNSNPPTYNFLTERAQPSLINIQNSTINHNFCTSRDNLTQPNTNY